MGDKIFFALVKAKNADLYGGSGASGNDPPLEIYLVNNTDSPITLKSTASGGFRTYDNDLVVMNKPNNKKGNIVIEPYGYLLYASLYIDDFDGVTQHEAFVEVEGVTKKLEIMLSRGIGFLGAEIPCMDCYGRIIRPRITPAPL